MKKSFLLFILLCILMPVAGCKTAPTDKTPESTSIPAETVNESDKETPTQSDMPAQADSGSAAQTNGNKSSSGEASSKAAASDTGATKQPAQTAGNSAATQAAQGAANPAVKPTTQPKTAGQAAPAKPATPKQEPAKSAATKAQTSQPTAQAGGNKSAAPSKVAASPATKQPAQGAAGNSAAKPTDQSKTAGQAAPAKPAASPAAKPTTQPKTAGQATTAKPTPQKQEPAKTAATKAQTSQPTAQAGGNKSAAPSKVAASPATKQPAQGAAGNSAAKPTDQSKTAGQAAPAKPAASPAAKQPTQASSYVASAQITDVSWMIEQADLSFVSKFHKGSGKMFVTVFAYYKGTLTDKDLQEALIFTPVDAWALNAQNIKGLIEIDEKNKVLLLKHLTAGDGEGAVALGKWFISITLAGQKPFEKELTVTGIGGQTSSMSADRTTVKGRTKKIIPLIVPTAKSANEQQALSFPVIYSVSRDSETIEIIFSIHDSRVKNAYFYFDVPGEEYYRDSGSMIDAAGQPVNGCRSFSTDGKKCQYVLRKDANNRGWFDKATRCFLVVSDVSRVASPREERHRTISAAAPILK